ncbi:hypothetical protein GYMLUDRAFT_57353 [Collybiopsis luxurians FD-317 M1]|uniref:Uncharacterized protein n=1 Tax=Collybiopsis luxurians FD-317 M1 TaxID=944289 RepID=A0A0D0CL58_9AGAR|nr:hypothetical protein GYMLUDRAFT_57353 [Collybiopsis luxurians FD-317 M1]
MPANIIEELTTLLMSCKYYFQMISRYNKKAFNLEHFLGQFFHVDEFLEFQQLLAKTRSLISDALAAQFVAREKPSGNLVLYCYLSNVLEFVQWFRLIGYAYVTYGRNRSVDKDIAKVKDDISAGITPSAAERCWCFSRFNQEWKHNKSSVMLIGCIENPICDIIRTQNTTASMNVLSHSAGYSLFPLTTIGLSANFSTQPPWTVFEENGLRQHLRWLLDHCGEPTGSFLPAPEMALTFHGPYSILNHRSFNDEFSFVIPFASNRRLSNDDVSWNSFRISYGGNWVALLFDIINGPKKDMKYCVFPDAARVLERRLFSSMKGKSQ